PLQPGEKVTISNEASQLLKSDIQDGTILTPNSGGGTTLPPWPPQGNTPNSGGGTTLPPWPPQDNTPNSGGGTTLPPWPPQDKV
ncbi:hypothetical protein, partial [Rheinheimera riviphila]|uniref:hypothetical protein n=1 Tax=Rheinheimera riviphila TaxID=1834037 RepID=UPI001981FCE3